MELRQLRYFLGVVSAGSFGKAAAKLHIAQPALSRQVKALEDELGVALLYRTARGVQMTEAGERLQELADYLLKTADRLRDEVRHLGSEPAGTVVVGLPPSLAHLIAPGLIRECRDRYPLVSIRVIEALSVFLVEWLEVGKIDAAVLTVATDSHSTERRELCTEQMVLVGTPGNLPGTLESVRTSDLDRFRIVTTGGFLSVLQPWFSSAGYEPRFEMEMDSIPILRELVRTGLNCTIVPFSLFHDEIASGELRALPLVEPVVRRTIALAHNSRQPMSLTLGAVGDLIAARVAALPRLGEP